MRPTQTGIAVALALAVVVFFFIYPGFLPFGAASPEAADGEGQNLSLTPGADASATMSNEITELQVTDETVGTGATAEAGDTITVNYVGSLIDGTVFDASANHGSTGFSFELGAAQVIQGWDQGIVGMKEGGKRKLVIPASLAYGDRGAAGVIPPGAALIFDVELLKVVKGTR